MAGFFVGWPNPPSEQTLRQLLVNSPYRALAIKDGQLIGFATGLSDGVLFSFLTCLEVLPDFQGNGLGKRLVEHLLEVMPRVYTVDLVCDPDVQGFYQKCGFIPYSSAIIRRHDLLAAR